MSKKRLISVILMVAVLVVLVGCGGDDEAKKSSPTITPATVTFVGSTPGISFAGIYGAKKEGYFADEQLEVRELYSNDVPELTGLDSIDLVASGQADFAIAGADRLLLAREAGKPVVAILALYQRDPTAIIAMADKGIETPEDLVGKTIIHLNRGAIFNLFAQKVGLDLSTVTILQDVEVGQGIVMFMTGQVDAAIVSSTEVTPTLNTMGLEYTTMLFYDYGVAMYPNLIFTTETLINEKPEVVQRFVNGMLRGMQYAVDNPADLATWFEQTFPDSVLMQQAGSIAGTMEALIPLFHPQGSEVGMMTADTWTFVHDAMVEGDLLEPTTASAAYTMQFLDAYYKK